MKFIVLLFSLFLFKSHATVPTFSQSWKLIELHNEYRQDTRPPAQKMPALVHSGTLSTSSNNWAQKCIWAHSGTPNVGENIYATSIRTYNSSRFDPVPAVSAWGDENIWYDFTSNSCSSGRICGHYTQMAWATTTRLGCAFQDCPKIQNIPWPNGGTYVVCQYSPPGNYWGQRPYTKADWTVSWRLFTTLNASYISYKGNNMWALDTLGNPYELVNGTWVKRTGITGLMRTISATVDNRTWASGKNNVLYRWNGSSFSVVPPPTGRTVIQVDGANVNYAVILDNFNQTWRYTNGNWVSLKKAAKWITTGNNLDIWIVTTTGGIARYHLSNYNWESMPGSGFLNMHATDLQNIVGTGPSNTIWRLEHNVWVNLPGRAKFTAMSNGKLYCISPGNRIYKS